MAQIKESLVLENKFSNTLETYIKLMNSSEATTKQTTAATRQATQEARVLAGTYRAEAAQAQKAANEKKLEIQNAKLATAQSQALTAQLRAEAAAKRLAEQEARAAAAAQEKLNKETDKGTESSRSLTTTLKGLVGAYVGLQGLGKLLNMSDTLTSTTARLDSINDEKQSIKQLNNMIFASANRTRASYTETAAFVAQLGSMAGDAFNNNTAEIVAFAEQINKQLVISGASGESASAAIFQLQQALASGVLRGEELNSVMEQTPIIAQTITEYLGVSKGELREMAAEGKITADVVKNAMFDAAERTNEKFENMPMTWSQVFTIFGNYAIRALQPVLMGLSWVANNLEIIGPLVLAAGGAFAIFQIAANWTKIAAVATAAYHGAVTLLSVGYGMLTGQISLATAAQTLFNGALAASPIGLVLMGVTLLVGALYAGVAAYNKLTGSSVSATGIIGGAMYVLGAQVYNIVAAMYNSFASFVNFLGNVFNNPVAAVKILFYDMVVNVLSYLRTLVGGLESTLNAIPGIEVNLTGGLDSLIGKFNSAAETAKSESGWVEYVKGMDYKDLAGAFATGYDKGANFNPFGEYPSGDPYDPTWSDMAASLDEIADDTGSIKKAVNMSQEDIKLIVDMAARRYVNNINLTAQTPVITINGANTGNTEADRKALADALKNILLEQSAAGSFRTTARVY